MTEYHVGCGAFAIYAGTLNTAKTMWTRKSEVTDEALCAVAQYLLQEGKRMTFLHQGKKYTLCVIEAADDLERYAIVPAAGGSHEPG